MKKKLQIVSGSSHPELAKKIYKKLKKDADDINIQLVEINKIIFGNENMLIQLRDNVREGDVFFIQTSCPPVSDTIIESMLVLDTLKHSSAGRITMVSPYWPYVRSDKKDQSRISIAAKLMARLHETAGADRFLTIDLHSEQIQGFFSKPVDQLTARSIFCNYIDAVFGKSTIKDVLVAPDVGEAKHLESFGNILGIPMAIIDKRRQGNTDTVSINTLIGNVENRDAFIIDDEVASAGTLCQAAKFIKEKGANSVNALVTHPVLSGSAIERINNSEINTLIVTDTIPLSEDAKKCDKIVVLSVVDLFANAILKIYSGRSMGGLF
jgi:ribose-phosphate pyrophosphokinase